MDFWPKSGTVPPKKMNNLVLRDIQRHVSGQQWFPSLFSFLRLNFFFKKHQSTFLLVAETFLEEKKKISRNHKIFFSTLKIFCTCLINLKAHKIYNCNFYFLQLLVVFFIHLVLFEILYWLEKLFRYNFADWTSLKYALIISD